MKKKLLFALLALLTTSAIRAADGDTFQANTVEGVEMTFKVISEKKKTCQVGNGGSNSCSINNSTVGTVTIPATVNDYNVTIIGNYAFNSCSGLTSITIPNSVTTIGNYAFNSCSGLTNITIPNSVTTIGDRAFQSCSGLTNITIPNSVTTIKHGAFKDCSSLTSVTISNSVTTIGSSAFQSCSGLTSITIPNSVTTIGDGAFDGCSGLTSITIPNSVTTIGDYAFQYCSGLTSINIPNSVTTIGRSAFQRCSGLTSITIPNSVTTIGDYAFDGCSGLTSINIPYSVTTIGDRAFQYCSGLTSINIPSSVTTIGNSVVDYCGNLSLVKVGWDSPINISPYAFPNREVMTLSVPLGTKEAYSAADYWKEFDIVEGNVYQVTIDGICYNLMEKGMLATVVANATTEHSGDITIPASVTYEGNTYQVNAIGNYAFSYCYNLKSINIPNSVTTIGSEAFYYCYGLRSITFPNSVTTIGSEAFYYCGLTSVTFPNSVTTIGNEAFRNCSGLTSITIPNSVTTIDDLAFEGCNSLSLVKVEWDSPVNISSDVFSNREGVTLSIPLGTKEAYTAADYWKEFNIVEGNTYQVTIDGICYNLAENGMLATVVENVTTKYRWNINVPASVTYEGNTYQVTTIGNSAFEYCRDLTSITIPNSVTTIGNDAFSNCSGMRSINIPNSVTTIGNYAFNSCSDLTNITIPNSVTTIGNNAFSGCSGLTSIVVEDGNAKYDSRNGCNAIINTESNELITGCKNTIIPNNVTSIGHGAFSYRSGLTSITIPNSVTTIGNYAFWLCSDLTSITIPNSVTTIGDGAFDGCINLSLVKVEWDSPVNISSDVFSKREAVTLNIPLGTKEAYTAADYWKEFNIVEGNVYQGVTIDGICYNLAEDGMLATVVANATTEYSGDITIPASVTYEGNTYQVYAIDNSAFESCNGLTSITIPNSVTTIGNSAFQDCSGLTSINIPNSVTTIGSRAFDGCSKMTSITIPNSVTTIGSWAFDGCSKMTSITIPNSVTTIGNYAFRNCSYLSLVKVGWDSPVNISSEVFFNSEGVTLSVPLGTKDAYTAANYWKEFNIVEGNVYQGVTIDGICYNLVEKGLQATVVANATADYSGDITIPASVMYEGNTYQVNAIGNNAFNDCSGLTSIISESRTPPTLGMNALGSSKQKSNITLYIPLQTTKTYQDAGWTGFKEYIEMTEGISRSLTISSAGQGTYCTDIDLDFSGIEDVKAYIASGFIQKTGTVILTRVTDVPAGTGLFVKGAAGTYEIPYKASSAYYKNMLKGNIDPVSVDPTTGDYANFYLSNGSDGLGFYRISSTRTMSANRAILCVPQSLFETVAEARRVNIVFDDETTGIDSVTHQTNDEKVYNLKGQRVSQPQRGLYIVDGKKVYVK